MKKIILRQLTQIFNTSVSAVLPENLISRSLQYNPVNQCLKVNSDKYDLTDKNVYLIGFGKAVQNMATEVERVLGHKIKEGIISVPVGSLNQKHQSKNVSYFEGAENNLPDKNAESTAMKIKNLISNLSVHDLLIVLISGGGSALLPLPKGDITLEEKTLLIKNLANSGADITELNIVRKRISALKGGELALLAQPATVVSFILSDIVGDPIDLIASAPTAENTDDPDTAIDIIKKYKLTNTLPQSIKNVLKETLDKHSFPHEKVKNHVIGSNKLSITEAMNEAKKLGIYPIELSYSVTGNVHEIAKEYVKLTKLFNDISKDNLQSKNLRHEIDLLKIPGLNLKNDITIEELKGKNILLILGGETTVEVKGSGKGGRNQQFVLEYSRIINDVKEYFEDREILFLSAGTDGIDGPTDAAGAIGYKNLISDALSENINPTKYLENNDSYNFFKNFNNGHLHIITGHTNTNVMDIHLIYIQNKI